MWRKAFGYLFFGTLFWIVGTIFAGPASNFIATAEPATLIVLQVDEKRDKDGDRTYRPVFGLETNERPRPEYAGPIWTSPKPHDAGDIVKGLYDPASGEMRSEKMAKRTLWIGRIAQTVGILAILQGVFMFFGVPELLLPLRLRRR